VKKNPVNLNGKTAFISGGSRGIGYGIAEILAFNGANIIIGSIHGEGAEKAADKLSRETGAFCFGLELDVCLASSVSSAFESIKEKTNSLDIAVNNAGVANSIDFLDTDEAAWDHVLDTNLKGVYQCCRAEIPLMLENGGKIVNIASISGSMVNVPQYQANYNTSKAGVIMLTKSLAVEYAKRGIRINSLSPGYTLTEMNKRPEVKDLLKIWADRTPMGRHAEVDEIASAALFLVSDMSGFITGHDLVVDGGSTIVC